MQTKINVVGKKDVFIPAQCYNEFPGSEYSERDDSDDDDDGFDDDLDQMEQYELRANSVIEIGEQGNIIALYSPQVLLNHSIYAKVWTSE